MRASLAIAVSASVILSGCVANTLNTQIANLRASSLSEMRASVVGTDRYLKANGEAATVAAVQEKVKAVLKDPDSAKFQGAALRKYGDEMVLCGQVNAKNAYGGYVGFTPFAAGINSAVLLDKDTRYPEITAAANAGLRDACGY